MKPSSDPANTGSVPDLSNYLQECARAVDQVLDQLVPAGDQVPETVNAAIRWSLFAGGKRLRPALELAVGEALGADRGQLLRTAGALELIHTYSLIHDDLPSMDDDDLRRGRATCHIKFGEAVAILAGDALQSLAFQAIAEDEQLPVDLRVRLIALIARASGTPAGMVAGQALDLEAESRPVDAAGIALIHRMKTGALICASAESGAMIARATAQQLQAVRNYAEHLGLLFQITDDLLDVTASSEELGKTPGKDQRGQKATYVSVYGMEQAKQLAAAEHQQAIAALNKIGADTSILNDLADHFLHRRA